MTMPPRDLVPGKLRVLRRIGGGGMGVVYEALHLGLDCRVAVKVIHPHCADSVEMRTRFLREARALAALPSEHIVRVLDVDTLPDGTPYMVMEYLEGRDLKRELRKRGALPVAEAVGYLLQACAGIAAAHRAGIVHRDIKPANIFITNLDGPRQVKILDFGVAKFTTADQSASGSADLIGTTAYMAPEQIIGSEADSRCDVWALGVVLCELLTGRSPFRETTHQRTLSAVLGAAPPRLHEERQDVPLSLGQIVTHCLEKEPLERFADASELAAALTPFAPLETTVRSSLRVARGSSLPPRVQGGDPLLGLALPATDSLVTVTASIPDPGSGQRLELQMPAPTPVTEARAPKSWRWRQRLLPVGSALTLAIAAATYAIVFAPTVVPPTLPHLRFTVSSAASRGSVSGRQAAAAAMAMATESAPAHAPPASSAPGLAAASTRGSSVLAAPHSSARPPRSSAVAMPTELPRPSASTAIPLHL